MYNMSIKYSFLVILCFSLLLIGSPLVYAELTIISDKTNYYPFDTLSVSGIAAPNEFVAIAVYNTVGYPIIVIQVPTNDNGEYFSDEFFTWPATETENIRYGQYDIFVSQMNGDNTFTSIFFVDSSGTLIIIETLTINGTTTLTETSTLTVTQTSTLTSTTTSISTLVSTTTSTTTIVLTLPKETIIITSTSTTTLPQVTSTLTTTTTSIDEKTIELTTTIEKLVTSTTTASTTIISINQNTVITTETITNSENNLMYLTGETAIIIAALMIIISIIAGILIQKRS